MYKNGFYFIGINSNTLVSQRKYSQFEKNSKNNKMRIRTKIDDFINYNKKFLLVLFFQQCRQLRTPIGETGGIIISYLASWAKRPLLVN